MARRGAKAAKNVAPTVAGENLEPSVVDGDDSTSDAKGDRGYFSLDSLTPYQRRRALDRFALELQGTLNSRDANLKSSVGAIMSKAASEAGVERIDTRHFATFVQALYTDNYLQIRFPRHQLLESKVRDHFAGWHGDVTVAAGHVSETYYRVAAEKLVRKLVEIGRKKGKPLNVGIVSGTSTGGVIRAALGIDWRADLDVDVHELPHVHIFALNVCLTDKENLQNNATILAFQLAQSISQKSKSGATPYGLSAPLILEPKNRTKVDTAPQTINVVSVAQPGRANEKHRGPLTELDLVLTGIGAKPLESPVDESSFFFKLARGFQIEHEDLIKKDFVGDLAYTAIDSSGNPIKMYRKEQGEHVEYEFYSAVELRALKEMAANVSKAVMLVAHRSRNSNKIPAIRAAIKGQAGPYVSSLIVDEDTAEALTG